MPSHRHPKHPIRRRYRGHSEPRKPSRSSQEGAFSESIPQPDSFQKQTNVVEYHLGGPIEFISYPAYLLSHIRAPARPPADRHTQRANTDTRQTGRCRVGGRSSFQEAFFSAWLRSGPYIRGGVGSTRRLPADRNAVQHLGCASHEGQASTVRAAARLDVGAQRYRVAASVTPTGGASTNMRSSAVSSIGASE